MTDKIAEIRARHEEGIRAGADADRAYLLAEVDRRGAENERMQAEIRRHCRHVGLLYDQVRRRADERDKAQIEVERLRKALEAKP